jgi:hypothetical protein
MKVSRFHSLLAAGLLLGAAAGLAAAEPPKADAALAAKLVDALQNNDYAAFIADGEPQFQQMPQGQFASVAGQLGARLKAGHTLTYLGDLHQHGYEVTLWKITFSDGSDDALATLAEKDGKVAGFFVR